MRLGLLADIHEHVEYLQAAITALRADKVDQFVVLGDIFEMGWQINETVALLSSLHGAGVWGNHDYGLCCDVTEHVRQRYAPAVLKYFSELKPSLVIEGCHFQHIEPFLDSTQLEDLWAYGSEGVLDPARSLAACPQHTIFMGHIHRWAAFTSQGKLPWDGTQPLMLEPDQRHLLAVHAIQQGWCSLFDTQANILYPIDLKQGGSDRMN